MFNNSNMNNNANTSEFNVNRGGDDMTESNEAKTGVIITEVSDDEDENEFKLKAKSDKSNYVDAISLNGEEAEAENGNEGENAANKK